MAFQHGKSSYFALDNGAGVLTAISAYCDNIDYPQTVENHETTTFQATGGAKTSIPGLKGGDSIGFSGKWDPTLDSQLATIYANGGQLTAGGSLSFEFGPAGNTGASGMPKYTGECYLTEYTVNDPVGDLITWSASVTVTGNTTRATY